MDKIQQYIVHGFKNRFSKKINCYNRSISFVRRYFNDFYTFYIKVKMLKFADFVIQNMFLQDFYTINNLTERMEDYKAD